MMNFCKKFVCQALAKRASNICMREKFITIVLVGITVGILVFFRFSFVGDIFVRFTEMLEQKVEELRMFGKESDASTEDDNIRSCLVSREATLAELRSAQLRILELRELLSFASSSPRTYLGADMVHRWMRFIPEYI